MTATGAKGRRGALGIAQGYGMAELDTLPLGAPVRSMRKFLLGLVVGIVVTALGGFIIVLAVGRLAATREPTVAGDSVLTLALDGEVPEVAPVEIPLPFLQSQGVPTVRDLWTSIHAAAHDKRIRALVIQPRGVALGWGKLQELHEELLDFKKSGKPVYAYLQGPSTKEFYLASVADQIYMSPDDMLDVKGLRVETLYLKNTLDKIGINFEVDHIGRYKDAGDMFTRTNMSPETREVLNQILDQLYGDFCNTVGQGRRKSAEEMRNLVDMGPFIASKAKEMGLVDQLGYEDQVYGDLKKKLGDNSLNRISIKNYFRAVPGSGDHIALIVGQGDIVRGESDNEFSNNQAITSGTIAKTIRQVRNDGSVRGVILRVDSPGGDAVASDEILHELKLLSNVKPLVISMSDVAASGGYFISMTGDPVLAYPNTITGSIGVIYARPNLRDLYGKLGLQEETITRGKLADLDSEAVPLSDAAKQKLHESIQSTYQSFVSKVAAARKRTYDQIDPIAQGRVWMGAQARQNGLVDELGGLNRAVALIRQKAKLPAGGETNLVMFPPRRSLLEILTNSTPDSMASAYAEAKVHTLVEGLPGRAMLKGGMLRILPYQFTVR